MTHDEFISLIQHPGSVTAGHVGDLKEMIEYYPYFVQPRILLAKAAHNTKSLYAENYINQAALYCSDRRWLYYYLYPEKKISNEPFKHDRVPKYSGNYFDLINSVESEGGDAKQSLKNLADRLKSARAMVSHESAESLEKAVSKSVCATESVRIPTPDYFALTEEKNNEISEVYARKLIKEKKYSEAIEILNKLNLINPKKSIYFADQIRFLEKVIVNSKK